MAALHSALTSLGPSVFSDIPSSQTELASYLYDLYAQSELILESIPIQPPADSLSLSPAPISQASRAADIRASSARSDPPVQEYADLQKEWGKPIKLSAKENPLNMSVYKLGGKDGKGAWFARRSVHDGLGFSKFKDSLEQEFPESLAVQGLPGEGNIRGIGGDRKVEDISVPGKGRVEVFQLSAQFPGPTTPRDFVTLLVTSSNAMKKIDETGKPKSSPRHYMVISKPCNHPDTQPRDSFIRGQYESVEFIREVPRAPKRTRSSINLSKLVAGRDDASNDKGNLEKAGTSEKARGETSKDHSLSPNSLNAGARNSGEMGRRRGKTISFSRPSIEITPEIDVDAELYPVEWIMVTRSDPGGSVPRFMVERGTPGSIVADASKFLDWACQREVPDVEEEEAPAVHLDHRQSFPCYETNAHLAGLEANDEEVETDAKKPTPKTVVQPESHEDSSLQSNFTSSVAHSVTAGLEAFAPSVIVNYLSGHSSQESQDTVVANPGTTEPDTEDLGSVSDSLSTLSFMSADSHMERSADNQSDLALSASKSSTDKSPDKEGAKASHLVQHEKELAKLQARRAALDEKLLLTRQRSEKEQAAQTAKDKDSMRKLEEKHARMLQKQEEKFKKEAEKLEAKKVGEEKKLEQRRKKEEEKREREERAKIEKDEKKKLERERNEAREEVKQLKAERDLWKEQVGELQKQNTALVVTVGKLEKSLADQGSGPDDGSLASSTANANGEKSSTPDKPPSEKSSPAVKNLLREENALPGNRQRRGFSLSSGAGSGSKSSLESTRSKTSSSWLKKLAAIPSPPAEGGLEEKAQVQEKPPS